MEKSLNPCCNGIYSMSSNVLYREVLVLILVVMEYTQWEKSMNEWKTKTVLILVVMEYTQWDPIKITINKIIES